MEKKYYQLATHTEAEWDQLNAELTHLGQVSEYVPNREIDCVDDQLHSLTRGTYLLTDTEAEQLKNDPRIQFINIDYKRYSEFKPPADELHSVRPELVNRYASAVKNYREFSVSNTLAATPDNSDINRTGYQLYRCTQKLDPWVDAALADNAVVNTNISQYGTGKNIDVIVADDGTWIGHPEFQSNSLSDSSPFAAVPKPNGYTGGNLLPGNGTCDLLDLVLDSPYYIDPEWFNADPATRLTTRWDGTRVPVESVARSWWSNGTQRSEKFVNAGTVSVTSNYTRESCNGTNANISNEGDHGTCCAALTYGRTQGWAYNANKWVLDLYGGYGIGIEEGFDLTKIFHTVKPVNSLFGSRDPTIMSNSWGYRSNKDPAGATQYYTHRTTSNVAYTTEVGINWLSHMGTQGDGGRWKSEMVTNSLTTAQAELIAAGVIFVAAAGNSNQKQVNSGHPDFNNYISTFNNLPLAASLFFEFGIQTLGTTNRRGFPQQGGMYNDVNGNRIYPVINIGALDDDYKTSKEAKVSYSDRGNGIDVYAPADGTLAANRGYSTNWARPDTYAALSYNSGNTTDAAFSGTSAACPVATGFIATVLEWNRDWTWVEVKAWLQSLETQDAELITGTGFNDTVNTFAIQSDGKILVGGSFTTYDGVTQNRITRLNTDGSRDTSFDVGTGFDSSVSQIKIQTDGKIVVGGGFSTYKGVAATGGLARLNADGSRDASFSTGTGLGSNVYAIAIQPDGKILFGGAFSSYNGTSQNGITRLNTDGSRDTGFSIGTGFATATNVQTIEIQSDGKIVVGGLFTTFNGVTQNRITRLNTDGSRDTGFSIGTGFNGSPSQIVIQPDGKILVGGSFTTYDGVTQNRITRLNTDGSRDTGFSIGTGFNDDVGTMQIQSDGKIVVGGWFTTFNGVTQNRITRLNTDGSRDTGFSIGTGFNQASVGFRPINSLIIQSNNKIVAGGEFTTYNATSQIRITRLSVNGSRDVGVFYKGIESTTTNTANWLDYESLEGGDARVLYQGPFDARFRIGPRQILSNLNIPSGLKLKLNR